MPSSYIHDDISRILISFTTGIFLISAYFSLETCCSSPPYYVLPLQTIGRISYSLYLWHWGVLVLSKWYLLPLSFVSYCTLSFALAFFSYYLIESPFRNATLPPILTTKLKLPYLKESNFSSLATLFLAFSSLFVSAGILRFFQKSNLFYRLPLISSLSPWVLPFDEPAGKGGYSDSCKTLITKNTESMECQLPPISSRQISRDIVLIGDSHASNNIPSIISAIKSSPSELSFRKFTFVPLFSDTVRIDNPPKLLSQMNHITSLVTRPSLLIFQLDPQRLRKSYSWSSPEDSSKLHTLRLYLDKLAYIASSTNSTLMVVSGSPRPCETQVSSYDLDTFILQYIKGGKAQTCSYPVSLAIERNEPFNNVVTSVSSSYSSLKSINFYDSLCPGQVCHAVLDGRLLFADLSPHLSTHYATFLVDEWRKLLLSDGIHKTTGTISF